MTDIFDRTPPNDNDAEQAILGLCLNLGYIPPSVDHITGIDFYRPAHEVVWETLKELIRNGKPCDLLTVSARLQETQELARIGGGIYLAELANVPPAVTGTAAAEIVSDRALRRHIINAHTRGLQDAYGSADEAETLLQRSEHLLASVPAKDSGSADSMQTLDEFLSDAAPEPEWVIPGLLARGERLILTGVEGGGKTTLIRQMALCAAAGMEPFTGANCPPQTVLMIDVENPKYIMQARLGELRKAINAHGRIINQNRLWIDRRPEGMNLGEAGDRRWLQRRIRLVNPDLIVIGPAYKLHSAGNDDKDETVARTITSVLDELRGEAGLILEHHAPNESTGNIRPVRPFGSSLWRRWPEFGYGIRPIRPPQGMQPEEVERRRLVDVVAWRGARDERNWPRQMESGGAGLPWVETVVEYRRSA